MNILRMNFSHGDQKGHHEVLERFRKVWGVDLRGTACGVCV